MWFIAQHSKLYFWCELANILYLFEQVLPFNDTVVVILRWVHVSNLSFSIDDGDDLVKLELMTEIVLDYLAYFTH